MSTTEPNIADLIALAQKSRGWVFRDGWAPQHARLAGGCELIVLTPVLWRGRCHPRREPVCELIAMRRTA